MSASPSTPAQLASDAATAGATNTATLLDAFAQRQLAYNDFIRAVGQAKLNAAQADLAEAQAALAGAQAQTELARAQILWAVATQLQEDLRQLDLEAEATLRTVARIRAMANYALHLLAGLPMADFRGCVAAYKYFEQRALVEGDVNLFAPLAVTVPIGGADFLDNRNVDAACDPPTARDMANALMLFTWACDRQYVARTGSAAQQVFAGLFRAIGSVAQRTIDALDKAVADMRSETYNVWQPVKIVTGLPASAAAQRILSNPGPSALQLGTVA